MIVARGSWHTHYPRSDSIVSTHSPCERLQAPWADQRSSAIGASKHRRGFTRYKHKDFARFIRIAKGSEAELLNHFQEAFDDGYLTDSERRALEHAARKAMKAAKRVNPPSGFNAGSLVGRLR